jgi:hypothetical protein
MNPTRQASQRRATRAMSIYKYVFHNEINIKATIPVASVIEYAPFKTGHFARRARDNIQHLSEAWRVGCISAPTESTYF